MDFNKYDYVEPKGVNGKIILTCFPGRDEKKNLFMENFLLSELSIFYQILYLPQKK